MPTAAATRTLATSACLLGLALVSAAPQAAAAEPAGRLTPTTVTSRTVVFAVPQNVDGSGPARLLVQHRGRWQGRSLTVTLRAGKRVTVARPTSLRGVSANVARKRVRLQVALRPAAPRAVTVQGDPARPAQAAPAPTATPAPVSASEPPTTANPSSSTRGELDATMPTVEAPDPAAPEVTPPTAGGDAVTPPKPVAGAERLGVNAQLLWSWSSPTQLAELRAAGVRWVRTDFAWAAIEPTKGKFSWTYADRMMLGAAKAGIDILAIAGYSAPWASSDPSGKGDAYYPPKDPKDFAAFVAAVLARYGQGGSFWKANPTVTPRPLNAVEIWNEAHGHWFWKGEPDVTRYAELVRTTIAAARAVTPGVKLLADGATLEYRTAGQRPWLDRLLTVAPDLAKTVDAWSVHPYSDPPSNAPWTALADPRYSFSGRVTMARDSLVRAGSKAPLWATEFGYCLGGGTCGGVNEQTQAAYLDAALNRLMNDWGGFVERSFVYTWNKTSDTAVDWNARFGLRRTDGSRRPAWDAVAKRLG